MDVSDFDFDLPEARIALRPIEPREHARLLCVGETLTDHTVGDLPDLLQPGDLLVLNDTKVIPAALSATRPARAQGGGGDVSLTINLHKRTAPDRWRAFIRPAKRLREGDAVIFSDSFVATVVTIRDGGDVELTFDRAGGALDTAVSAHGRTPLPPYIAKKRDADAQDESDYQTVYADDPGSVAAPTAGLHFTDALFARLAEHGVEIAKLTLHVGAGTFLPVKSDRTEDHDMHSEWYDIGSETAAQIAKAKAEGRRVVAVGTTSLRALEASNGHAGTGDTNIFITPGYTFKVVDGLMTNFHLPRSTLFMLVSALVGTDTMQTAYAHAIETGYRFYSYGDSSLIWRR
ncbi:S-adenosylmethionine:tRNA ribosyltransferase-isomerase [Algimonas arctica]|uniref:S-adenosylmethionine:tRNA ribosyltransferase-isomerase n=1 Tax=Algimonas arctica TaxID=1479486 RepID=A0A8J3G366_9PROT|nr:tRNA preQ1(34) S-adenosylmethionine ribosyltransferase-isomerase QueA [Algimonas arctica]GHB01572.1 S-adenosylmethionine:tRNA ribosyltransferase-isomerase [Algimonas arctica]